MLMKKLIRRLRKLTKIKILLIILFLLILIFTRFFNLAKVARFDHDDARNLRDIHRIYVMRDLTLIGPINGAKNIIYPSLTFYMLMPFAILGNFEPTSLSYGAAFYGVLTVFLLIYIVKREDKSLLIWAAILTLVWFPLIDSSRIAWNPHLVPFVQALAIITYMNRNRGLKYLFLSGFLFGLTFHLHYFSIVSTVAFFILILFKSVNDKKIKEFLTMCLGFILTIIPFIVFDFMKPPGLFFGRFLHSNIIEIGFKSESKMFFPGFLENFKNVLLLLGGNNFFAMILSLIFLAILYNDIKNKSSSLMYFIPPFMQVLTISFLPEYYNRYFYLSLIFFFVWLFAKRKKAGQFLVILAIVIMVAASLKPLKLYLTKPVREPSALTVEGVNNFISEKVNKENLKNINIAVLASPDPDPLGEIYRQTLLVKNINLLLENQYQITDNLFIVTTSGEEEVRRDPANVMDGFRNGKIAESGNIENNWKIYLFNRDKK